jgi:hypothetical protein
VAKLNDDQRRALKTLAHQDGCAEAVLLADGFSDQLAGWRLRGMPSCSGGALTSAVAKGQSSGCRSPRRGGGRSRNSRSALAIQQSEIAQRQPFRPRCRWYGARRTTADETAGAQRTLVTDPCVGYVHLRI